jgi:hypothetical protein
VEFEGWPFENLFEVLVISERQTLYSLIVEKGAFSQRRLCHRCKWPSDSLFRDSIEFWRTDDDYGDGYFFPWTAKGRF